MKQHDVRATLPGGRFWAPLGGVAWCASSGAATGAFQDVQRLRRRRYVLREDRFGRMFPGLPPFAEPGPELEAALVELGGPGGILDARDALDRGPVDLILDPALSANNPNNPTQTAGTTFVGQFLDHDMVPGGFRMVDFLTFAGVDPGVAASRPEIRAIRYRQQLWAARVTPLPESSRHIVWGSF